MVIYAVTSTGITFNIFRDYFWYYLLAIICFSIVGIINLYFVKTKDIIRELPPLIFLTQEIWVYQFVCLRMAHKA